MCCDINCSHVVATGLTEHTAILCDGHVPMTTVDQLIQKLLVSLPDACADSVENQLALMPGASGSDTVQLDNLFHRIEDVVIQALVTVAPPEVPTNQPPNPAPVSTHAPEPLHVVRHIYIIYINV